MTTPPGPPTRGAWLARRARPLLAVYALVLAVILLSPSAGFQSASVEVVARILTPVFPDAWINGTRVEVLLNILIIAPVSFLGRWVVSRVRWQDWTAYGFIGAVGVESFQGLFLPHRSATFSDVVANTLGALVGALLARILFGRHRSATPDPVGVAGRDGDGSGRG